MKKFSLFLIMAVACVLVFVFAVSAEAVEFKKWGAPIYGVGQMHIFGNEGASTQGHDDGWYVPATKDTEDNKNYDGYLEYINTNVARVELKYGEGENAQYITYPTYYILKNDSTLTWDFSWVRSALGDETIGVDNITQIEIPYGITVIPERAFVDSKRWDPKVSDDHPKGHVATPNEVLKYVYIPNTVLTIEDFAFAHCTSLSSFVGNYTGTATGDHNHQMLQHIGYRAFHDCPLTSFIFNNHLVYLGESAFEGCHMSTIDLSRCRELKVIPKKCFHEGERDDVHLVLSNSIERIEEGAFEGLHFSTVFLGTSLKYIGANAFEADKISLLVVPVTLVQDKVNDPNGEETGLTAKSFLTGAQNTKIVIAGPYTAASADALAAELSKCPGKIGSYSGSDLIDYTVKYYKKNPNACVELFGGHSIDDNSKNIQDVKYPNGIGHAGIAYGGSCGICLAETTETTLLTPILVSKGYSICTYNGVSAFSNGFEIYHDALHAYESVHGECELGILFLRSAKYIAGSDLKNDISSMGVCLDRATLLQGADPELFSSMDFIFTYSRGLGTIDGVNREKEEVVIAAYLLHKDSTKAGALYNTSYYLQDIDDLCVAGKTSDGKYVTVSYYSIYVESQKQGEVTEK